MGRGGVAAIGQRNSEAIERAATGAYASRADATRAVGRSVFGGRARPKKPCSWLACGVSRSTAKPHAPLGVSGSPHVLVNARPAVQVPALRDHRIGGDVQADVTLERALALARVAPLLLSRGDLARSACGFRLARERAPVPRRRVSREGRVLRLQPVPPRGTPPRAERRRHPPRRGAACSGDDARSKRDFALPELLVSKYAGRKDQATPRPYTPPSHEKSTASRQSRKLLESQTLIRLIFGIFFECAIASLQYSIPV